MGNAIYLDLIQALVMVQVDHLVLAVSNIYKYRTGGRAASSSDYKTRVQSLKRGIPTRGSACPPASRWPSWYFADWAAAS